jgi:hypothetical protein
MVLPKKSSPRYTAPENTRALIKKGIRMYWMSRGLLRNILTLRNGAKKPLEKLTIKFLFAGTGINSPL